MPKSVLLIFSLVAFTNSYAQCTDMDSRAYDSILELTSDSLTKAKAEQMQAENPNCWISYNVLGYAHYKDRHYEESEKQLLRARELNPSSRKVLLNLSNTWVELGKIDSAFHLLNDQIQKNPNDERFITNRGLILKDLHYFDEAKKDLKKAKRIISDNTTNFNLAILYYEHGKRKKAIRFFKKAFKKDNSDVKSLNYLLELYTELDDDKNVAKTKEMIEKVKTGEIPAYRK